MIETFEVAPDYVKHFDELGRMIKKIIGGRMV